MRIPIPLGERYEATLHGSTWKMVQCVKCGEEYVYRMERSAAATGVNVLWLDSEGAIDRARKKAKEKLKRTLDAECDPVPCPQCDMYQPDMVCLLRSRKLLTLRNYSLIVFLSHMMFAGIALFANPGRYGQLKICLMPPWGLIWMAALALLIYTVIVRRTLDPNVDAFSRGSQSHATETGPFLRKEFERRVADAEAAVQAEQAARAAADRVARESACLRQVANGQWVCSVCETVLEPGFVGECPVCRASL